MSRGRVAESLIFLQSETTFSLPEPHYDFVTVKFHSTASKHGHFRLPEIFYDGVVYGLTWENSHKLEVQFNITTFSLM